MSRRTGVAFVGSVTSAAGAAIASVLGGCAASSDGAARAAGRPVVALVFAAEGGQSALGIEARRGAELAFESETGQALGVGFAAFASDRASNATAASDPSAEAVVAVGFTDSDELRRAARAFVAASMPVVVAGATDPCLVDLGPAGAFTFACYSDAAQAAAMAEYALDTLGAATFAVARDPESEFAGAVATAFVDTVRARTGRVTDQYQWHLEHGEIVASLARKAPGAIYLAALPDDAAELARLLRAEGYTGALLGPDSCDSPAFAAVAGAGGVAAFTTHAALDALDAPDAPGASPAMRAFVARYEARYGTKPTGFAALGFDAAGLARRAVEAVQAAGVPVTRAAVAEELRRMPAEVAGSAGESLTGALDFAGGARFPAKPVWIERVEDGKAVFAARVLPTMVPTVRCGP